MSSHLLSIAACLALTAQAPSRLSPITVDYTIRVDPADLSGIAVEMQIRDAPAGFHVAMVTHTEYDDEYWRYLTELRGESGRGIVRIAREDSSLWRVAAPAGLITLRYRVRFPTAPPMQQASWKAHLTPVGGLLGGPHSFLYVVGAERSPARVTVVLPDGWRIATGLDTADAPRTFTAPNVATLVDSPMLVGLVRSWQFDVGGVPHQVSYLGHTNGTAFDTTLFVRNVERLAREAIAMFGRMPYRDFQFLFEDGAYGGLEHTNSVSMGAQSANLARDPNSLLSQLAHEFFHTWNEVHLRPASWIGVRHAPPAPTGELWWSEGVTLFYADLLLRRAGLHTVDSTRIARLGRLISNYLANPSHALVSPEATSRAFNKPPTATGDYTPSMFTQGELLGTVLDLMIRDGSGGARSLDDAMRTLSQRFTIDRGFTGLDVERAVAEACACDAHPFFDRYVRSAGALDFDRWLEVIGLRMTVTRAPALASDGTPAPDVRFSANAYAGDSTVRLNVWFPTAPLGRAGFHTGDQLVSLNGAAIHDVAAFRAVVGQLRIGDTLRIVARRGAMSVDRALVIAGYDRPTVAVAVRADATAAQRRLRELWMAGR
jgi:predicted metalloprotease with PDZ domain